MNKEDFYSLKPRQIIYLRFSDAWSGIDSEKLRPFRVGRRSHSKKYNVDSLKLERLETMADERQQGFKLAPYVLRCRGRCVSLSHGDMACSLRGFSLVPGELQSSPSKVWTA